jgi:pimeloyl-ACP methyl ester carboxylesterase
MDVYGPVGIRLSIPGPLPGLEREPDLHISGIVFLPPGYQAYSSVTAVLLRPGGSYSVDYWHQVVPGLPVEEYSCAMYLAAHGFVVIATDHLGTGRSSQPDDGRLLTLENVSKANALAGRAIRDHLEEGTLSLAATDDEGRKLLAALPGMALVQTAAFGHSMGAMLLTAEQSQYGVYDAVGFLGWSNQQLSMSGIAPDALTAITQQVREERGYVLADRTAMRPLFYLADVPTAVIEADEACAIPVPLNVGLPAIGRPGIVAEQAGRIDVPVLHVLGTQDVSGMPSPLEEVTFYRAASQYGVTLYELPASGHCHNYAGSRWQLWSFMVRWVRQALGAASPLPAPGAAGPLTSVEVAR